jgi:two-component system, OmpR family, response regulator
VFLVVDGWLTVRKEFEDLEDAVADLTARGLTYGLHVVVAGLRSFLTGRSAPDERLAGLAWGDDYLGKPFAVPELVVRVRSLCRRGEPRPTRVLRHAGLEMDTGRYEVRRAGRPVALTAKEFVVLRELIAARGEPVPRPRLIAAAWDDLVPPATNVLDVLIAQLRRKLGAPPVLHTVRGVGHLLR